MITLNKLIVRIFIILLIIVTGEVLYYFIFITPKSNPQPSSSSKSLPIPPPEYQTQQSTDCSAKCVLLFPSPFPQQAVKELELANLRVLKKDILKTMTVQYIYEGKLEKVEYNKYNNIPTIRFTIRSDGGDQNNFYYPQKPYIKIFDKKGSFDFFSLKIGQSIRGKVEYDLLTGNFKEIEIKIIN